VKYKTRQQAESAIRGLTDYRFDSASSSSSGLVVKFADSEPQRKARKMQHASAYHPQNYFVPAPGPYYPLYAPPPPVPTFYPPAYPPNFYPAIQPTPHQPQLEGKLLVFCLLIGRTSWCKSFCLSSPRAFFQCRTVQYLCSFWKYS
jgi:hypothetical protein